MYRLILILSLLGYFRISLCEGTKELCPTPGDFGGLIFNNGANDIPMGLFTPNTVAYPAGTTSADYRINIRIANAGEIIYGAFTRGGTGGLFFRLVNPLGVQVIPPTGIPVLGPTYAQYVNGPSAIVGAAGYAMQINYTSNMTGDYYIEFNSTGVGYSAALENIQYFDITVATSTNVAIKGRLWSKAWQITTFAGTNSFSGTFFAYSNDGIVNSIKCQNMQPFVFGVVCNSFGVTNTGNNLVDRRSIQNGITTNVLPEYMIFLNDPDPLVFPTGTFGNIIGTPTITGCTNPKCLNIEVDKAGKAEVILNINGLPGYQVGTSDRLFIVDLVLGTNCISWDGLDGLGNLVPPGVNVEILASYQNSLFHLPLFDIENNVNGFQVALVRPAGAAPLVYWDDTQLLGTVGASIDGNLNLTGCAGGCHRWSGKGINTCAPCPEIINSWWYSNTITLSNVTTTQEINLDALASTIGNGKINNIQKICDNTLASTVSGLFAAPSGVSPSWTSINGSTFSTTSVAAPTVTFSGAAYAAGFEILVLNASGAICPVSPDSVLIPVIQSATSNAGSDLVTCSNNAMASLTGVSPLGTFTYNWSGGSGTFSNNVSKITNYIPSAADIIAGSVVLTFTVVPTDPVCPTVSDNLILAFTAAPTISIGPDTIVCSNNSISNLLAIATNSTAISWTSSSSCVGCFNSTSGTNVNYTPSVADLSNTTVDITATATKLGCLPVSDQKKISYVIAPTPNAGIDQLICNNNLQTNLSGSISSGSLAAWSSSSGCTACFTSSASAVSSYNPSVTDVSTGTVYLILSETKAGCNTVKDSLLLVFTPSPTINAGLDLSVCLNNPILSYSVTTAVATGIQWSNATGVFSGGINSTVGNYTLSNSELVSGSAILIATTTGNGNCLAVSDSIVVSVAPAPTVDAGPDQLNLCFSLPTVNLNGTSSTGFGNWSGGVGGFSSTSSLTPTYTPTVPEKSGTITLTLTSANNGNCLPVTDQINISFLPPLPSTFINNDTALCKNTATLNVGALNLGFTSINWSSSGSGSFSSTNSLNSQYVLSSADTVKSFFTIYFNGTNNCGPLNDSAVVQLLSLPVAMAGSDLVAAYIGEKIQLNGTGSSTGPLVSYNWISPNNTLDFITSKSLLANALVNTFPSKAILSVYDSNTTCSNFDTLLVTQLFIEIPNIFSPNADGTNDYYRIKNIEFFPEAELRIYDQWSNMIFSAKPAHTYFWDGKLDGKDLPAATYYYTLNLNVSGYSEIKGNITIVR